VAARGVPLIAFLVVVAVPRLSAAADRPKTPTDTRIEAVNVSDQADGSIVSVKLRGRTRPRILRSVERLVAIVIADVDADGELDIIASTIRQSLLFWRNAGRGHFVLARLPKARDALARVPRVSRDKRATAHDEPGEGAADEAVSRADGSGDPLVLQSFVLSESFSPLAQSRVAPTGRAPPSIA
jgi:hypothetical protein